MVLSKLKEVRNKEGLTYREVAHQVGISKEYYWMIENGRRRLNYEIAVKIAKVFHSSPDCLFLDNELTYSEQNDSKEVI